MLGSNCLSRLHGGSTSAASRIGAVTDRSPHAAFAGARTRAPSTELDWREGPRDECGVFGVYAPEHDVARLAYFALYALQHRGQESAGIATAEDGRLTTQRDLGLVS